MVGLAGVVVVGHVSPLLLPWLSILVVAVGLAVIGLDLFSTQASDDNDVRVDVKASSKSDKNSIVNRRGQ